MRRALEAHEREHQAADEGRKRAAELAEHEADERARLRRSTRRYWVTIAATVVGSNLATILLLASKGKA